jgi:hypothetical protein
VREDDAVSYDFAVYAARTPDEEVLRRLVTDDPSLSVVDALPGRLGVDRSGSRGTSFAFEVRGPFEVAPAEIPVAATATALGISTLYPVVVPAASSGNVRVAAAFCRRLADATDGVVLDPQLATSAAVAWPPASRRASDPPPEGVVDVVRLDWLLRAAAAPEDLAERYLRLCAQLLPEALPVGFGPTASTGPAGPFPSRLDRDGEDAFTKAWRTGLGEVTWSQALPCLGGSVDAGGPVRRLSMTVLRGPLHDPRWRAALLALLPALAEESGAFYASAQVLRGFGWDAQGLSEGAHSEVEVPLAPDGGWLGLPPEPVWATWFGYPYAELVADTLSSDGATVEAGGGLLHLVSEEPVDREQIAAFRAPIGWLARTTELLRLYPATWLPRELSATRGPRWAPRLRPARVHPPGLDLTEPGA